MSKKYYAVYPGKVKIDNEIFFGIDYKITDFINELTEQVQKQKEVIDKAKKLIEHFKLTEWGMNGYEPLDSIQNILNENEVSE